MKNYTYILVILASCTLFGGDLAAEQIHLNNGQILQGKVIDKTHTKYIIEKINTETNVNELVELDISSVTAIIEESTGEIEIKAGPDDNINLPLEDMTPGRTKEKDIPEIPNETEEEKEGIVLPADIEEWKELILEKRDSLGDIILPHIEKMTGEADNPAIDFIKDYCVELPLALIIVFLFFIIRMLTKTKSKVKINKEYLVDRLPGLTFEPFKEKKLFKNIAIKDVFLYYQVSGATKTYTESICKAVNTDGASVITKEDIPMGTTLRLIIVRERMIGKNQIKEDIHLNADVKNVKEAPVSNFFEVYLSFGHLFLSQRAFISKLLSQSNQ